MQPASSALLSLLGAAELERFEKGHWPHSVFFAQADPHAWPELLHSERWCDPHRIERFYAGPIEVTRGFVAQYRVQGASLSGWVCDIGVAARLCDLRSHLPGAAAWLDALESELGLAAGSAKLSAFVNPPGVGLGAHCDPCEHLLIHVAGEKHIRVAPNPAGPYVSASHSVSFTPTARECLQYPDGLPGWTRLPPEAQEFLLQPGSVLFMPRGTYHETVGGGGGVSTSVVVKFEIPSHADLLIAYLQRYLVQSARWRAPALAASSREAGAARGLEASLAELLCELGPRVPMLSPAQILAAAGRADSAPPADRSRRYMRNPSIAISRVEQDGTATAIRLARNLGRGSSETLAVGADAISLIEELCALPGPLSFEQLAERFAGWAEDSLARIVDFLARKEVLVPLCAQPYEVEAPERATA